MGHRSSMTLCNNSYRQFLHPFCFLTQRIFGNGMKEFFCQHQVAAGCLKPLTLKHDVHAVAGLVAG